MNEKGSFDWTDRGGSEKLLGLRPGTQAEACATKTQLSQFEEKK